MIHQRITALVTRAARRFASAGTRASERGQVLISALFFIGIFMLVAWFLIDIAGIQNVASRAISGSLRLSGLATLQERGTTDDYGRWYVCPPTGQGSYTAGNSCAGLDSDYAARQFLAQNLVGDAAGGYDEIWLSSALDIISRPDGTNNGTQDGLDVEILDPAAQAGQTSDRFLNGVAQTVVTDNPGSFPECIRSELLPGPCFSTATVILHIRMPDRHILSSFGTIDTTVLVKVGTDAN